MIRIFQSSSNTSSYYRTCLEWCLWLSILKIGVMLSFWILFVLSVPTITVVVEERYVLIPLDVLTIFTNIPQNKSGEPSQGIPNWILTLKTINRFLFETSYFSLDRKIYHKLNESTVEYLQKLLFLARSKSNWQNSCDS